MTYDAYLREKRFTYWALGIALALVVLILCIPDGAPILADLKPGE